MKTYWFISLLIILLAVTIILCSCAVDEEIYIEDVTPFDFHEDSVYLTEFSAEMILGRQVFFGEVETAEKAARCAEEVWIEVYGEEQILQQRPCIVQYNEEQEVWCVKGNSAYLDGALGGVAYAYIARDDGQLLVIVHDE